MADFVGASNRLRARVVGPESAGRYRVAIEGVGERSVPGAAGLSAGAEVIVVIRPEELDLAIGTGNGPIEATVVDVAFQGAQRVVRLRSLAVGELVASTAGGAAVPERGAEVVVGFRDERSWAAPLS